MNTKICVERLNKKLMYIFFSSRKNGKLYISTPEQIQKKSKLWVLITQG